MILQDFPDGNSVNQSSFLLLLLPPPLWLWLWHRGKRKEEEKQLSFFFFFLGYKSVFLGLSLFFWVDGSGSKRVAGWILWRLVLDGILFYPPILIGVNINILRQKHFSNYWNKETEKNSISHTFFCLSVGGNIVSIGFLGKMLAQDINNFPARRTRLVWKKSCNRS